MVGDRITFYIPYAIKDHDRHSIVEEFNDANIGQVDRIDLVQNKFTPEAYSLHVHLYPYKTQTMYDIIDAHSNRLGYYHKVSAKNSVSNRSIHDEYWWICKSTNPIPDTYMNIHQAASYIQTLECKVDQLTTQMKELAEKLESADSYEPVPEWLFDDADMPPLTMEELARPSYIDISNQDMMDIDSDAEFSDASMHECYMVIEEE